MKTNFRNSSNISKYNSTKEKMNLTSIKIAKRKTLEWDAMCWPTIKEVKTYFAEVPTGNKLKTKSSSKHYLKLGSISNKILCKQLKWEST